MYFFVRCGLWCFVVVFCSACRRGEQAERPPDERSMRQRQTSHSLRGRWSSWTEHHVRDTTLGFESVRGTSASNCAGCTNVARQRRLRTRSRLRLGVASEKGSAERTTPDRRQRWRPRPAPDPVPIVDAACVACGLRAEALDTTAKRPTQSWRLRACSVDAVALARLEASPSARQPARARRRGTRRLSTRSWSVRSVSSRLLVRGPQGAIKDSGRPR